MELEQSLSGVGFREAEWNAARGWDDYLASVEKKREIWDAAVRRAKVSDDARERLQKLPAKRRVLVLTEDWCGDAARSIPALAAAFGTTEQIEARYLDSDAHPETLTRFLTHGGRAIPMAIVQDEAGAFLGAWGPRPAPLQALMRARKRELGSPTSENMAEWYAPILGWYGRDKGVTTIDEMLMLLERGGAPQ